MNGHPESGIGVLIEKMNTLTERVSEARDELKENSRELNKVKDQLVQTSFELQSTKSELALTKTELNSTKVEIENIKKMLGHYRGGVAAILGLGGLIGWALSTFSGVSKLWAH